MFKKILRLTYFFCFFSGFKSRCCHIHWFYAYCSFKHSNLWRQIRSNIEYL